MEILLFILKKTLRKRNKRCREPVRRENDVQNMSKTAPFRRIPKYQWQPGMPLTKGGWLGSCTLSRSLCHLQPRLLGWSLSEATSKEGPTSADLKCCGKVGVEKDSIIHIQKQFQWFPIGLWDQFKCWLWLSSLKSSMFWDQDSWRIISTHNEASWP